MAHAFVRWSETTVKKLLGRHRILTEDAFTTFLKFINAGMLEPGNVHLFEFAIRHMNDEGAILEIGSFAGLSTNLTIYFLEKHKKPHRFFTVDPWKLKPDATPFYNGKFSFKDYNAFVKESYKRNLSFFNPDHLPHSVEDVSASFFEKWKRQEMVTDVFGRTAQLGGPLSFCYIDGDHAPDAVRLDFRLCDQYLLDGGFLLFDDSHWEDLKKVMQEIEATGRYKLVMRNPNYLFQKTS